MNYLNYGDFVAALAKPGEDILKSLSGNKCHLLHMVIGVVGEVGELYVPIEAHDRGKELDLDNIKEELGDIEFFLEGLRQGYGINHDETVPEIGYSLCSALRTLNKLSVSASELLDATKKYVIYNKPLDVSLIVSCLKDIEMDLSAFRAHFGLSREDVIQLNKEKLSKRYSEGSYSDKQAQERADKQ